MLEKAEKNDRRGRKKDCGKYTGQERTTYLKRLAAVKTTPLELMYLNYYRYFPHGNEELRADVRNKFVSTARFAEIDRAREHHTLDKFVDFTESEVKIPENN